MDVDETSDSDEEEGKSSSAPQSGPVPTVEGWVKDVTVSADERRARFRQVWLGKVVEAFGGELEEMRQVSDRAFLDIPEIFVRG